MPALARGLLRLAGRQALPAAGRGLGVAQLTARAGPPQAARGFSGAARKVSETLKGEIKHEEEQYEQAKEIAQFLKGSQFKLVDTDGDVNMMLERTVGSRLVRVEWQLTSPFPPGEEGENEEPPTEATDFSVTVEDTSSGAGVSFYCSTQTGEDHRYVIGNVKSFTSVEERDLPSGYNGPEFEDLDDKVQEALDEYLAEVGLSNELCDLMDAMALDKEQREYIQWLKKTQKFLE